MVYLITTFYSMFKRFYWVVFLLAGLSCKQPVTGDILIQNVHTIDVETGELLPGQDIIITGNTIHSVSPHGHQAIEAKTIIDGTDQYLIPGLWDMHAHMMRENWYVSQMPLLRANGITGFREMWGDMEIANNVREEIENGRMPYFRFVASGHVLDGAKPFWSGSIPVESEERAVHIVDSLIKSKADFIKVYSFLSPAVFSAIAQRCKEKRISFSGHVPHTEWVTSASEAGMASMEHLYGFLIEACSESDSAMSLMQRSVRAFEKGDKEQRNRTLLLFYSLVLNNFSEEKMRWIAQKLTRDNTYIVPTLVTLRGEYFTNDTSFTNDPRLKYMSKETLDYWKETAASDIRKNTSVDWQNKRRRWEIERQIMQILIAEKVPIMAGTDADNPYAFPGFSLHDEVALYVEYGMTPREALYSATIAPVKFLGMSDSLGTISKGKLADLVLLNANPLEDIKNTTKVSTVIANGKIYGKAYIDSVMRK